MPRPRTVDDETILDVTRQLVSEKGMSVSTRAIASAVGISEAVIFQRFSSKAKLLEAALGSPEFDWRAAVRAGDDALDARTALEEIALAILGGFRRTLPDLVPALGDPTIGLRDTIWADDGPVLSCVIHLEEHLRQEMERGRLGAGDPHVMAFVIVSALHSAALFETLQGELIVSDARTREMIGGLWDGLGPRP